jgi:hypothetical protein
MNDDRIIEMTDRHHLKWMRLLYTASGKIPSNLQLLSESLSGVTRQLMDEIGDETDYWLSDGLTSSLRRFQG